MLKIFKRFFDFCGTINKRKLKTSMWLGVLKSFFEALKIPAIYIMLSAIVQGNLEPRTILTSFLIMIFSVIGTGLIQNKCTILQTEAGYESCANKRIEIAEHMRYVPMGYFNKNSLGQITNVTTNVAESMSNIATRIVMMCTQGYISTAIIIVFMFIFDWRIGLIASVAIVLFFMANSGLQAQGKKLATSKFDADEKIVDSILEYVQGIAEVKAYNLTGEKKADFDKANENLKNVLIRQETSFIPFLLLQALILKGSGILITIATICFYLNGSMTLADALCMIISSFLVFAQMESAGNYSALLRNLNHGMELIEKVLAIPEMDINGENLEPVNHNIELENISFSYDKRKIIDGLSLKIPEGSTTAFVGPSGGGKTTLCHLVSRFWDVDSGTVKLGGRNVQDYSMDSLMKNFSFVFQNVYLFKDTIANNIRFGQNEMPMEKVIEAAKKACCHDFIMALPDGYETVIGEGGASLSGGEKQRISIARAILKDSPIIILDEATANVDPENEADLVRAIDELTRSKTILMIAHRLKTVRKADNIVVIENGKIAEQGKHEELIDKGGIYSRFVDSRNQAVGWKI